MALRCTAPPIPSSRISLAHRTDGSDVSRIPIALPIAVFALLTGALFIFSDDAETSQIRGAEPQSITFVPASFVPTPNMSLAGILGGPPERSGPEVVEQRQAPQADPSVGGPTAWFPSSLLIPPVAEPAQGQTTLAEPVVATPRASTVFSGGGAERVLSLSGIRAGPAEPAAEIREPLLNPDGINLDPVTEADEQTSYKAHESPPGRFTQLSVGGRHNCGLREDGSIFCWGDNSEGQSDARSGSFIQVSAGFFHNCGVREDWSVECWGATDFGDVSSTAGTWQFVAQPPGPFVDVSADGGRSCGLRADGSVACWGSIANNRRTPPVVPSERFVQISVGADSCGLMADGGVLCWGTHEGVEVMPEGPFIQYSVGGWQKCGLQRSGRTVCRGWEPSGYEAPTCRFVQISVGYRHSCGVREDGGVVCWGDNTFGQSDPPAGRFQQVGAGGANIPYGGHSCGLREDGTVECWGGEE